MLRHDTPESKVGVDAADIKAAGGALSVEDLAAFRAYHREALAIQHLRRFMVSQKPFAALAGALSDGPKALSVCDPGFASRGCGRRL